MVHGQEERKINKGHYNKDKGKQYNNYYYKKLFTIIYQLTVQMKYHSYTHEYLYIHDYSVFMMNIIFCNILILKHVSHITSLL